MLKGDIQADRWGDFDVALCKVNLQDWPDEFRLFLFFLCDEIQTEWRVKTKMRLGIRQQFTGHSVPIGGDSTGHYMKQCALHENTVARCQCIQNSQETNNALTLALQMRKQ